MSAELSLRSALLAIDEAIVRINKFMEDESKDSEVPDLFNRQKADEFLTLAKRHLDEAAQSDPGLTASIEKGDMTYTHRNILGSFYYFSSLCSGDEGAIVHLEKAIAFDDEPEWYHLALAIRFINSGRSMDEVKPKLERAVAINPGSVYGQRAQTYLLGQD